MTIDTASVLGGLLFVGLVFLLIVLAVALFQGIAGEDTTDVYEEPIYHVIDEEEMWRVTEPVYDEPEPENTNTNPFGVS